MTENNEKWMTVPEYAKKIKKTKGMVYLMIRLGQIARENIKRDKKIIEKNVIYIKG